jgi:5-(carboxyamino)imidazole ribonucleotide mutase
VAIGSARNAGLLAARMLSIADPALLDAMVRFQEELNRQAKAKSANLT